MFCLYINPLALVLYEGICVKGLIYLPC